MGEYTKVEYARVDSSRLFGRQLGELASTLKMPMPMFKGRKLLSYIPRVTRWRSKPLLLETPELQAFQARTT
jgi:hypothetical protein